MQTAEYRTPNVEPQKFKLMLSADFARFFEVNE